MKHSLENKFSALARAIRCLPSHLISYPFKPTASPVVPPYSEYGDQFLVPYKVLNADTPEAKKRIFLEFYEKTNPEQVLFTDASKSEETVSFAITNESRSLLMASCVPSWCSVYTAELLAIEKACLLSLNAKSKTLIVSDSLSSIEAIRGSVTKCPIVDSIRYKLHHNRNIHIVWCPSHVGIAGNEAADKEAKLACKRPLLALTPSNYIDSLRIFKAIVRAEVFGKLKASGPFFPVNAEKYTVWSKAIETNNVEIANRRAWVQLTRLQLGHFLAIKQFQLTGQSQPNCSICVGVKLTAWHIFAECSTAKEMYNREGFVYDQSLKILYPTAQRLKLFLNTTLKILKKISKTCMRI